MSFPQHLLAIPTSTTPAPTLAEELAAHQSQLSELVDHFSKDGYTLAVAEESDETAPLSDREMMFLVRGMLVSLTHPVARNTPEIPAWYAAHWIH